METPIIDFAPKAIAKIAECRMIINNFTLNDDSELLGKLIDALFDKEFSEELRRSTGINDI
jgi:hypothetical protein